MGANHWYAIYEKSLENPESIINTLTDNQQVNTNLVYRLSYWNDE